MFWCVILPPDRAGEGPLMDHGCLLPVYDGCLVAWGCGYWPGVGTLQHCLWWGQRMVGSQHGKIKFTHF